MNISIRLALIFALVFTFVLAGCGSSGGSKSSNMAADMSGGGSSSGGSTPSGGGDMSGSGSSGGGGDAGIRNQIADHIGNALPAAVRQAAIAATSIPRVGSVTQSSNVDSSNVTLDQVEATASYNDDGGLRVSVTNSRTGSWGTISSSDTLLRSNVLEGTNTGTPVQQRSLGKRIGNGAVVVDVLTTRRTATDTDYLVGGVWLLVPDFDTPAGLEIGAFMDGPADRLTPATYLQTTATASYLGDASGLFLETANEGGGEFTADVALTANFRPTNPSISGRVSNFQEIDFSRDILSPVAGNPVLTLGSAPIGATPGGFFTGDTGGTQVVGGVSYTYSGKWGGQFYGDQADYIGGTFGGNTKNNPGNPDYELVFMGVFGGYRQDDDGGGGDNVTGGGGNVTGGGDNVTGGGDNVTGGGGNVTGGGRSSIDGSSITQRLLGGVNDITTDLVETEVTSENGQLVLYSVTGLGTEAITLSSNSFDNSSVNNKVEISNGALFVNTYSDYDTTTGTPDTDYLAGGYWIYYPDDAASEVQLGVFVDGNDPFTQSNLMAVTGAAMYEGRSTGVYSDPDASLDGSTFFYGFDAGVSLRANFGTNSSLGTISGTVHDFVGEGGISLLGNPMLTLGSAAIGTANSGFFEGNTSATVNGENYTGQWGGQFYSNGAAATDQPGSVGGTFSGVSTTGISSGDSFLGGFGAFKN